MNRREAIQRTVLALGYAISAPALAGVLKGCKAAPELSYKPVFFTEDQARTIAELAEIIIPKTSTPGAKDAGVPGFIDSMLNEVYEKEDQDSFLKGLAAFEEDAKNTYAEFFTDCKPEDQVALFKKHHDEALAAAGSGGPTGWWNTEAGADKPFILKVKELTLLGFFTSEPGATQVLQYNQVPGPYQGCVPLAEVGKAWAT
ncbi:MAG: gluconate 2-dehydrogenase subunit 3 family protein [Cyclobacteriaceae bacterium]|jgi:gluconate 2-dehydrogenase gamma chain|nr:gluconate 2-dehydrogenase subunit 3 family protein [Cyclobacteriaceae bacterium]MDH4294846.1 gluconate 2-dehydrogenase subunit 3 family protein [Cyclobacteriaceae bacterium]MDH5248101.1 gluconate 2-dehydrogenase subunit 3 family protein [Cyclobacteriaceae bacterium]